CQSILSDFLRRPVAWNWAQKSPRGRRGTALKVRGDSIEARDYGQIGRKIKRLVDLSSRSDLSSHPGRRRLSSGRLLWCQSILSDFLDTAQLPGVSSTTAPGWSED